MRNILITISLLFVVLASFARPTVIRNGAVIVDNGDTLFLSSDGSLFTIGAANTLAIEADLDTLGVNDSLRIGDTWFKASDLVSIGGVKGAKGGLEVVNDTAEWNGPLYRNVNITGSFDVNWTIDDFIAFTDTTTITGVQLMSISSFSDTRVGSQGETWVFAAGDVWQTTGGNYSLVVKNGDSSKDWINGVGLDFDHTGGAYFRDTRTSGARRGLEMYDVSNVTDTTDTTLVWYSLLKSEIGSSYTGGSAIDITGGVVDWNGLLTQATVIDGDGQTYPVVFTDLLSFIISNDVVSASLTPENLQLGDGSTYHTMAGDSLLWDIDNWSQFSSVQILKLNSKMLDLRSTTAGTGGLPDNNWAGAIGIDMRIEQDTFVIRNAPNSSLGNWVKTGLSYDNIDTIAKYAAPASVIPFIMVQTTIGDTINDLATGGRQVEIIDYGINIISFSTSLSPDLSTHRYHQINATDNSTITLTAGDLPFGTCTLYWVQDVGGGNDITKSGWGTQKGTGTVDLTGGATTIIQFSKNADGDIHHMIL